MARSFRAQTRMKGQSPLLREEESFSLWISPPVAALFALQTFIAAQGPQLSPAPQGLTPALNTSVWVPLGTVGGRRRHEVGLELGSKDLSSHV